MVPPKCIGKFQYYLILFYVPIFALNPKITCPWLEKQSLCELNEMDREHCKILKSNVSSSSSICCTNVTNQEEISNFITSRTRDNLRGIGVSAIHIHNSNMSIFNLRQIFSHLGGDLNTITISKNHFPRIIGNFGSNLLNLACLDISQNTFNDNTNATTSLDLLSELPSLHTIIMRENKNWSNMPQFTRINSEKIECDFSGSNELPCKSFLNLTEVIYRKNSTLKIINVENTSCQQGQLFGSDNYIPVQTVMNSVKIYESCDKRCNCTVSGLDDWQDTFVYYASVICSNKDLTEIPDSIPKYIKVLNLSHNKISNITMLTEPRFSRLRELDLKDNLIVNIGTFADTVFLEYINYLDLSYNKIVEINYNAFQKINRDAGYKPTINLENNEFACNCHTAMVVKKVLEDFKLSIPNHDKVMTTVCSDGERRKVLEMDFNAYCESGNKDIKIKLITLIVAEVTALVLLIAKVYYDYNVFKKKGYLPWPASKMPKLPCDWYFEK